MCEAVSQQDLTHQRRMNLATTTAQAEPTLAEKEKKKVPATGATRAPNPAKFQQSFIFFWFPRKWPIASPSSPLCERVPLTCTCIGSFALASPPRGAVLELIWSCFWRCQKFCLSLPHLPLALPSCCLGAVYLALKASIASLFKHISRFGSAGLSLLRVVVDLRLLAFFGPSSAL